MPGLSHKVSTVDVAACPLCQSPGAIRYQGLEDKLCFCPGQWNLRYCKDCDSYWLDPRPLEESFDLIYPQHYPMHAEPWDKLASGGPFASTLEPAKKAFLHHAYGYPQPPVSFLPDLLGRVTAKLGYLRSLKGDLVRFLPAKPGGTLLDIGCANGEFLLTMARLGWTVCGIEPDATSAAIARHHGLDVEMSFLDQAEYLLTEHYDAISMSHVIEHLPDPAAAIQRISRAIKPGGRFVSISPNPRSAMALFLGAAWLGWDPPRHFVLPGSKALSQIASAAGLAPNTWTRTPLRSDEFVARRSLGIVWRQNASAYHGRWLPRIIVALVRAVELADRSRGDEIVLVGRKA